MMKDKSNEQLILTQIIHGKGNMFVLTIYENKTTTKALMLKLFSHNAFDITFTHTLQDLQASPTTC